MGRQDNVLAMRDKNVPLITLRGLFDSFGIMALALGVFVTLSFSLKGAIAAGTPGLSLKNGVSETTQRIPTQGGGNKGELVVHVLKANPSPNAPVIVLCPGSWEYSKAWEVYFPPFTPEFLAKRGFVVVTWDPRGAFMLGAGAQTPQEFLDPNRYGLGASSPFPPALLMLSRTFVEDYERILSFTGSLEGIDKEKIAVVGFSHGATYPVIEKVLMGDKRVKLIFSIEPVGDEASLVNMILGPLPGVGPALTNLAGQVPEGVYERALWEPLEGLGFVGLATQYASKLDVPLFIVQSERFHASVSGIVKAGQCTLPGVSLYEAATNVPFKKLNRNPDNAPAGALTDFFPSPIWYDGELLCDYFVNYVEPAVLGGGYAYP
jgi:hypothetical protein